LNNPPAKRKELPLGCNQAMGRSKEEGKKKENLAGTDLLCRNKGGGVPTNNLQPPIRKQLFLRNKKIKRKKKKKRKKGGGGVARIKLAFVWVGTPLSLLFVLHCGRRSREKGVGLRLVLPNSGFLPKKRRREGRKVSRTFVREWKIDIFIPFIRKTNGKQWKGKKRGEGDSYVADLLPGGAGEKKKKKKRKKGPLSILSPK